MASPNGTATSIATDPMITLPTKIVRRSKRSRRGNQPVSVSRPKSQSMRRMKLIAPSTSTYRISRLMAIDATAASRKTTRIVRSRLRCLRLPRRSWIVSVMRRGPPCDPGTGRWPADPGGGNDRPRTATRCVASARHRFGPRVARGLDPVVGQVDVPGIGNRCQASVGEVQVDERGHGRVALGVRRVDVDVQAAGEAVRGVADRLRRRGDAPVAGVDLDRLHAVLLSGVEGEPDPSER